MSRTLILHRAGPCVTVQDMGRSGFLGYGLSRGGAVDRRALTEGAALLGQSAELAALELAGFGGEFSVTEDTRIALTGAPMQASIDGVALTWNASHLLARGARLVIGAAKAGSYGYLHLGGGLATPNVLKSRATHLAAGIGAALEAGARLPIGDDPGVAVGQCLPVDPRFDGGKIRLLPSLQTKFFAPSEIARFEATEFRRDAKGNRMGARLICDGEGFHTSAGLSILSEIVVPGDIQITGDGTPFVLLSECQTTGGYPRIGSVLPCDLARMAQAGAGARLRFCFVGLEDAVLLERQDAQHRAALAKQVHALIRDPNSIPDLLSYQLISGMIRGDEFESEQT